jgi:uncharacterized C2H2 Zn-finger protein
MGGLKSLSRCPRCGYKLPQNKDFMKEIQKEYANAFKPWKLEEDAQLKEMVSEGVDMLEMCKELGRQPTAIQKRITLMKFEPLKQEPPPQVSNWQDHERKEQERVASVTSSHLAAS